MMNFLNYKKEFGKYNKFLNDKLNEYEIRLKDYIKNDILKYPNKSIPNKYNNIIKNYLEIKNKEKEWSNLNKYWNKNIFIHELSNKYKKDSNKIQIYLNQILI